MKDIFDAKIMCERCNVPMAKIEVSKDGIRVRAVECPKCKEKIIHPEDKGKLEHFKNLKGRTFSVKLRMVGNSHTISIPKEIVDLMQEEEKMMKRHLDNMVRLCFEDFGRLRVDFFEDNSKYLNEEEEAEDDLDEVHRIALERIKKKMRNGKNKLDRENR